MLYKCCTKAAGLFALPYIFALYLPLFSLLTAGLFAYHLLPFIATPVMALNSVYDATMGPGECGNASGIVFDWANATSVNACGNYIRGLAKGLFVGPSAGE